MGGFLQAKKLIVIGKCDQSAFFFGSPYQWSSIGIVAVLMEEEKSIVGDSHLSNLL